MSVSAREAALRSLMAFRKSGAWSEIYLNTLAKREGMDRRETALAHKICFGVLQNMALCDHYINSFSTVRVSRMEPAVADILRLSVYQILFLDRIPHRAAVSEGVSLAKRYANPRAVGLVNAVLRRAAQEAGDIPPISRVDPVKYLSVMYSHPEWLVRLMRNEIGNAACEEFLRANNTEPHVCAVVNTLKCSRDELIDILAADGVTAERHPYLDDCIYLRDAGNIENLRAFTDGLMYIQDAAAYMAVLAAGVRPGMRVIDTCSAPGGKSFAAAIMMRGKGDIISCDIHAKKLRLVDSGAERLGVSNIIRICPLDASKYVPVFKQCADTVIADVPCSGLGVIRKKPDIRYKDESLLEHLPEIQSRILSNVSKYVKPGGVLLYSTCTVLRRENEDIVNAFLKEDPSFTAEQFDLPGIGCVDGMTTLWPHINGTDGFFIAKLRRNP